MTLHTIPSFKQRVEACQVLLDFVDEVECRKNIDKALAAAQRYIDSFHEVYEAGAAHKDGRLRPGDQILEVMKEDTLLTRQNTGDRRSHTMTCRCSINGVMV